jgi:hypothetical protein
MSEPRPQRGDNVIMEFAGEVADLLDESRAARLATEVRR